MSNSNNRIIVFASILGAILATGLLALNPSTITNANAQTYGDQYGYGNYQKKSSHTDIQKIKCVNSNINVNGIDITQIPTDDLATAESGNEGEANGQQNNLNGLGDRINVERNLVNVCVNVNANEQLKVEPPPEPATLTVKKEIFGCTPQSASSMNCNFLQDGSDSWLPCIGSSISGTGFCQNLPPNLFDIEVLDDQHTQLQQFEGSTAGTTIQNLQPGTYTVNEIKHASSINQLGVSDSAKTSCTTTAGFDDGGNSLTSGTNYQAICFEYEDEQGNDCSTVTLATGEDKTCTVKNYIFEAFREV